MANHTINGTGDGSTGLQSVAEGAGGLLFGGTTLGRLLWSVGIILVALFLSRYSAVAIRRSAGRLARQKRLDEQQARAFVGRASPMVLSTKIAIGAATIIALLGVWGLKTAFTGLLAGAGFAGIVIGLAAADTIGDVIAGFLIFYNNPFDIGDWVEIDGMEGMIDDVALGATTLITWDNEKVTIPNRVVEGTKVKNFSQYRVLRRRLVVGVEYGSDLGKAMDILVRLARDHPEVLPDPEPSAVTIGFGSSSVDLVLRFYVEPVRTSAIKIYTDLVHQVHDTFRDEGIVIAFPHMQVVQARPWQLTGAGPDSLGAPGSETTPGSDA